MKSKRAEEFIRNSAFSAIQLPGEVMYSIHMNVNGKLLKRKNAEVAVKLAEQDAEEEVTRYRTELEESKKREELARKVIDDQREEMEKLKERAVEAHRKCCFFRNDQRNECANTATQCGEHSCFYMDIFIQKLNEK